MKMTRLVFMTLLALGLVACTSPQGDVDVDLSTVPCICGEPEAAIDGCSHAACLSGEGNPDNPDCVCAPIDIGEEG